ncbi:hypothetical protein D9M68_959480 [compost metagenome]
MLAVVRLDQAIEAMEHLQVFVARRLGLERARREAQQTDEDQPRQRRQACLAPKPLGTELTAQLIEQ